MHYISLYGVHICHGVTVGGMICCGEKVYMLWCTIYTHYAIIAHFEKVRILLVQNYPHYTNTAHFGLSWCH